MIQISCRLWNLMILGVMFLSTYNILLTLKLMYSSECPKFPPILPKNRAKETPRVACSTPPTGQSLENLPLKLELDLGRWDNSLQYKLFDNIIVGDKFLELSTIYKTCLATQSSLDKLISILEVAEHWNGPISVATFTADNKDFNSLILYVLYLRRCNKKIREQVVFHLAFPKKHQPSSIDIDMDKLDQMDCESPAEVLHYLLRSNKLNQKWRSKVPYPQNHLRNLARKNCQSTYVFLTDIDIIPSRNMAEELNVFLEKDTCKGLCAFVVATYELDDRVRFPPNKTELVRLATKKLARPFHQKVFIYNQYATNFSRWEQKTYNDNLEVHVSHPVTNFEFLYEPFYVALDTVPVHDERFVGYGYTRNSQVYEMFVAGYEFLVLSPIFTCHWGLQLKRTRPPWREQQNNINRNRFDNFKREIFVKYKKDPLNMVVPKRN